MNLKVFFAGIRNCFSGLLASGCFTKFVTVVLCVQLPLYVSAQISDLEIPLRCFQDLCAIGESVDQRTPFVRAVDTPDISELRTLFEKLQAEKKATFEVYKKQLETMNPNIRRIHHILTSKKLAGDAILSGMLEETSLDYNEWKNPWDDTPKLTGTDFLSVASEKALSELEIVKSILGPDFFIFGLSSAELHRNLKIAQNKSWQNRRDIAAIFRVLTIVHFLKISVSENLKEEKNLDLSTIDRELRPYPINFQNFLADVLATVKNFNNPNRNEVLKNQRQVLAAFPQVINKFYPQDAQAILAAFHSLKFQGPIDSQAIFNMASEYLIKQIRIERKKQKQLLVSELFERQNNYQPLNFNLYVRELFSAHSSSFYLPFFHFIDLSYANGDFEASSWAFAHELGHLVYTTLSELGDKRNSKVDPIKSKLYEIFKAKFNTSLEIFDGNVSESFADSFAALAISEMNPKPMLRDSFLCHWTQDKKDPNQLNLDYLINRSGEYPPGYFRILNLAYFSNQPMPESCNEVNYRNIYEAISAFEKRKREH